MIHARLTIYFITKANILEGIEEWQIQFFKWSFNGFDFRTSFLQDRLPY